MNGKGIPNRLTKANRLLPKAVLVGVETNRPSAGAGEKMNLESS